MTSARRAGATAAVLLLLVALAACGQKEPEAPAFGKNVNVGQAPSSPGWGTVDDAGRRSGFDHDLADWLAIEIGFTPVPVDVLTENRERKLQSGEVQLIVATYSITDARLEKVGLAGPYMKGLQGVLIKVADKDKYRSLADLAGKSVCATNGSTSVKELEKITPPVNTIRASVYEECITRLHNGEIDAVSTDQLILFGYLVKYPGEYYVPSGISFGNQERYGVGYPKGDVAKCQAITKSLKKFLLEGQWETFFARNLPGADPAGHKPDVSELGRCEP